MQGLSFVVRLKFIQELDSTNYSYFVLAWTLFQSLVILVHFNLYSPIAEKFQGKLANNDEFYEDVTNIMLPMIPVGIVVSIVFGIILVYLNVPSAVILPFSFAMLLFGLITLIQSFQRGVGDYFQPSLMLGLIGIGRFLLLYFFDLNNLNLREATLIYLLPIIFVFIVVSLFFIRKYDIYKTISTKLSFHIILEYVNKSKWVVVSDLTRSLNFFFGALLLVDKLDTDLFKVYDLVITMMFFISLLVSNFGYALLLKAKEASISKFIDTLIRKFLIPFFLLSIVAALLINETGLIDRIFSNLGINAELDLFILVIIGIIPVFQSVSTLISSFTQGHSYFYEDAKGRILGFIGCFGIFIIPFSGILASLMFILVYYIIHVIYLTFNLWQKNKNA